MPRCWLDRDSWNVGIDRCNGYRRGRLVILASSDSLVSYPALSDFGVVVSCSFGPWEQVRSDFRGVLGVPLLAGAVVEEQQLRRIAAIEPSESFRVVAV